MKPMIKVSNEIVVFPEKGFICVKVFNRYDDQIQTLKRLSGEYRSDGKVTWFALPWHDDTMRVLVNLGYEQSALLAAPLLHKNTRKVEGAYKPMLHQLITAAYVCLNPRCYVLSDPRTGKTGSLVLAMDYLRLDGGWLIATTMTTMQSVWAESIQRTLPHARVVIAHRSTRESAMREKADFYITNYDSVRLSTGAFKQAVMDGRVKGCVIDELTHMSNASSQRFKAFNEVVNGSRPLERVIGLTGSPGSNPEAIYGMCRMINAERFGYKTKGSWLAATTYRYGPEPYMLRPTEQAPEIIHRVMQPAIRFAKKDILDLPPVVTQERTCEMSKEQRRVRQALLNEAYALLDSGEVITAANGGVLMSKLLQVALGFAHVSSESSTDKVLFPHADRTQTILDVIKETDRKVVIFTCFKESMRLRMAEIKAAGYTVELISGATSAKDRTRILYDFQNTPDPHILIAHPQTVSYGVELSASDTMIFDGPPMLGGFIYAQALERLSSSKQTAAKISVIKIISSPEEKHGFALLDRGQKVGSLVAGLFEEISKDRIKSLDIKQEKGYRKGA